MYYTNGLKYSSTAEYALDHSNAAGELPGASSRLAGSEPSGLSANSPVARGISTSAFQKARQVPRQELLKCFSLTGEEGPAKIQQTKWLKYQNTSWSLWCLASSLIWTSYHTLSNELDSLHHSLCSKEQRIFTANKFYFFFCRGRLAVNFAALKNKHSHLCKELGSQTETRS